MEQVAFALIVCLFALYFTARNDCKKYRLEIQKYKHEIQNLEKELSRSRKDNKDLSQALQRAKKDLSRSREYNRRLLRAEKPVSAKPPPELYHGNVYWTKLSDYCRAEKKWSCEVCKIDLKHDTQYLDTHHKLGRGYNSPQHLKVLCVGCHAKQKTPMDHSFMKADGRYRAFMNKYPKYRR